VLLAGYLHDIGKLAVPREILDKPTNLDRSEYGMIKSHAYYTRRIVESFSGLEDVAAWASSHHEHLDGKGYPFHLTDLPLESRVVAVADVFTALAEDRPYRPGYAPDEIRRILANMVAIRKLDGHVVHTLLDHQEAVDRVREGAQRGARTEFAAMVERAHRLAREPS
jgi:HD-GYP domain-containing protein (c-di-GMP phosphodiesterase class II)